MLVCPNRRTYYADAYHCVYHSKYVEQTEIHAYGKYRLELWSKSALRHRWPERILPTARLVNAYGVTGSE